MKLSKTTLNFAEKRNIDVFEYDGRLAFTVNPEENDCACVEYLIDNNMLTFSVKWDDRLEDLPAHIDNEITLRKVIDYVAKTVI